MKVTGASVRRFLDKPDKAVRAVLLYGPNESFVHEAAQTLARWAVGKSDDPYAITKLSEQEMKSDGARLADALAAQSLLGGPTVVWARVDGKGADRRADSSRAHGCRRAERCFSARISCAAGGEPDGL